MKTCDLIGYVNAGGRGTRLNGLFHANPKTGIAKALLEIGSPPIPLVDHHIANLRSQAVQNIVVSAGDQKEVYEYIQGRYQSDPNVNVIRSTQQLGTGGDLIQFARTVENSTPLLIQNVDTILDIDLSNFVHHFQTHRAIGGIATIALTLNTGVPNQDAYAVGGNGVVVNSAEFNTSDIEQEFAYRASSTGAVVLDSGFLRDQAWNESQGQLSLYKGCLRSAWEQEGLYAYNNATRFFRDVGTVATWLASEEDIELQNLLRYNQ